MRVTAKAVAIAGVASAASFTLYPQSAIAHPVVDTTHQPQGVSTTVAVAEANIQLGKVVVKPGDTLSSIALAQDVQWTDLAAWNHLSNANFILPGQVINIPPEGYAAPYTPSVLYVSGPAYHAAPASTHTATYSNAPAASYSGGCSISYVRSIEDPGGNPNQYNLTGSGAWGLYQFMPGTYSYYAKYVPNSGSYGNASAAQQTAVFEYAVSHGGRSNWAEC